ncbi:MAG: hypothetical protein LBF92_00180 [Synergistaceae bacterium]|jgi:nickel transport protein|nr:hypothetical protein [Synergistaceae bacterium]
MRSFARHSGDLAGDVSVSSRTLKTVGQIHRVKEGAPVPFRGACLPKKALEHRSAICICLLVPVLLLASPDSARAHGVGYRQAVKSAVAIEFYYSTGETMAYEEFRVYSPQDDKNTYQSGRTDEFGRCSFVPESPGTWRVVVSDMEGHRAEASIPIPEEFFDGGGDPRPIAVESPMPEGLDLYLRAALGVSVLFNAAAAVRLRKCM